MINLAVVDEAHCVSEWGHQFRTAYLRLGATLRRVARDASGTAPPILALTGTASRAVLRDVLFELEIDAGMSEHTLIRPRNFDRPELHFEIISGDPESSEPRLLGYLRSLPNRFRRPPSTFYQPRDKQTSSGIIFCPHVNGKYGAPYIARMAEDIVGIPPAVFTGSAPKGWNRSSWDYRKREAADAFKRNEKSVLVATNSFGMGIDKPNIRWIIHYGMPDSIESYYQEAGRAGRDGKPSRCAIIFSELDETRSRALLDHDQDLEVTRTAHDAIVRGDSDDITRALFFLLASFDGVAADVAQLGEMIDEVQDFDQRRNVELPFGDDDTTRRKRERAIHRLVVLGSVSDYTVDWGSRTFGLHVNACTPEHVRSTLLAFVGRTQPARVSALAAKLDPRQWEKPRDALIACGHELIEFVYDTIERSRRRSMREMWLATRQGDGTVLRERILDYLTEGDAAPLIEQLLNEREFTFGTWMKHLDNVDLPDDAAEWRGTTARMLVSEPEHPGLLLARAVSELRAPNGSHIEFRTNLTEALTSAPSRYQVSVEQLEQLAEWLLQRLELDGRAHLRPLLVTSFHRAGLGTIARQLSTRAVAGKGASAGDAIVYLAEQTEHASEQLAAALDALQEADDLGSPLEQDSE